MSYKVIDNFLNTHECNMLIKHARKRLQPSEGWDVERGASMQSTYRVSHQMWFQRDEYGFLPLIDNRIAKLTGYPVENGELLQVVRYLKGGHYYDHHDGFDPGYAGNNMVLNRGGQRVITVLMYLNSLAQDGSDGGATYFPRLGLRVYPKKGRALVWRNTRDDSDGRLDPDMIHAGEDLLTDKKEKWILTKWIRERPFY